VRLEFRGGVIYAMAGGSPDVDASYRLLEGM